jgi:hypothetical protein
MVMSTMATLWAYEFPWVSACAQALLWEDEDTTHSLLPCRLPERGGFDGKSNAH